LLFAALGDRLSGEALPRFTDLTNEGLSMRDINLKAAGALLLAGAGLALAGCGDRAAAPANNNAGANAMSAPTIGNDASAMETVANQPAPSTLPPPPVASENKAGRNSSAAEPAPADSAPGGDRGGNVQSNVAGM
jgi:hypothetical protein